MTANSLLMQLQADLAGVTVVKPQMAESTCLGAAMVAGAAVDHWNLEGPPMQVPSEEWRTTFSDDERDIRYTK